MRIRRSAGLPFVLFYEFSKLERVKNNKTYNPEQLSISYHHPLLRVPLILKPTDFIKRISFRLIIGENVSL